MTKKSVLPAGCIGQQPGLGSQSQCSKPWLWHMEDVCSRVYLTSVELSFLMRAMHIIEKREFFKYTELLPSAQIVLGTHTSTSFHLHNNKIFVVSFNK